MKAVLLACILLTGCVTTPQQPNKKQLSAHFLNPSCLLICITHITVEDNDGEDDTPAQQVPYDEAP